MQYLATSASRDAWLVRLVAACERVSDCQTLASADLRRECERHLRRDCRPSDGKTQTVH